MATGMEGRIHENRGLLDSFRAIESSEEEASESLAQQKLRHKKSRTPGLGEAQYYERQ